MVLYVVAKRRTSRPSQRICKLVCCPAYLSNITIFAESKAELRKQGQLIDDFDILIGVTAVANKMTLVSENLKHLSRIPNIKTENWIMRNDNIEYHKSFHRIPFTFYAQATCTAPESQYT